MYHIVVKNELKTTFLKQEIPFKRKAFVLNCIMIKYLYVYKTKTKKTFSDIINLTF